MPEKKGNEFALADKDQVFQIQPSAGDSNEKQITLNISQKSGSKILLRKTTTTFKYTGNRLVDFYNKINQFLIDHSKVTIREKATFYRLLSVMLNAGIPLVKSLNTLGVQNDKNQRLASLLFDMAKAIEGGRSLSDAMGDNADIFLEAEIGVVKAGEASGQLNKTLKSLASEIEKTASITNKIKGALVYPTVIMCLLVAVIFLMMIMVVPQISKLFTQTGNALPWPTRVLIATSDFCVNYWPVVLIGFVGFVTLVSLFKKTKEGKYFWDLMILNLPIFGKIFQKGTLAKFAREFSNLMGSGVPIIKSIEICAYAVGNEVYKRRLLLTAEDMKRGIPMAENLAESKLFPKLLVNMIEVGEQTAQLETVTLKVASFYDEEIDTVVKSLTKIMEPMILVIIGVTVGGLVSAIMLPIIQLTNISGSV